MSLAVSRRVLLLGLLCVSCSYGDADPDRRTDYVATFAGQSVALDAAAQAIIVRASARARLLGGQVVVAGYADDPAAPEANQIESRLRAQAVATALVADGVVRDRVEITPRRALGGDPGIESRRVDIRLGQ